MHDVPYARAKSFFDKLREISDKKNKSEKLADSLKNANDNIKDQQKRQVLNKILKLYTYKKLDGMCNACTDYDNKILKPTYGKELLQKLYLNMKNKSQYNYADRMESTNKPTTTKLRFNKKIVKNNKVIEDKQAIIKKCIPSFVSYLDKKIKERNQNTLNQIKKSYASKKFCDLLKAFSGIISEDDPDGEKKRREMSEDLLKRARFLVVCGKKINDDVRADISVAKRSKVIPTTLEGVLECGE
jgi:hypothetical protein